MPLPNNPDYVVPYQELRVMEEHGLSTFPKVINDDVTLLTVNDLLNGVDLDLKQA